MAQEVQVVVSAYAGVIDEVIVCHSMRTAEAEYNRIREALDIHSDEEAESEHDCQWLVKEIQE